MAHDPPRSKRQSSTTPRSRRLSGRCSRGDSSLFDGLVPRYRPASARRTVRHPARVYSVLERRAPERTEDDERAPRRIGRERITPPGSTAFRGRCRTPGRARRRRHRRCGRRPPGTPPSAAVIVLDFASGVVSRRLKRPSPMAAIGNSTDRPGQTAPDDVLQDLHHLLRALRHRLSRGVDFLQRVGERSVVQHDQGLAEGRGKAGVEGGVPLPVLVAETHHIGVGDRGAGANGVELGAFVIAPGRCSGFDIASPRPNRPAARTYSPV